MAFKEILFYLLIFAVAATGVTLVMGVSSMFRKGHTHQEQSNKLMRLRILLQAGALVIFALLLFFGR